jgi:hypothetical protein
MYVEIRKRRIKRQLPKYKYMRKIYELLVGNRKSFSFQIELNDRVKEIINSLKFPDLIL